MLSHLKRLDRRGEVRFESVVRECRSQGIGRIDWLVKSARSQRFYERLGATLQPLKRPMRLDGQALADLAEK